MHVSVFLYVFVFASFLKQFETIGELISNDFPQFDSFYQNIPRAKSRNEIHSRTKSDER